MKSNTNNTALPHTAADLAAEASQVQAAAAEMTDAVANEAKRFGEIAKAWWQQNAGLVANAASTVRDEAGALGNRGYRYVRNEPLKSVLIAAGVGAAITGLLALALKRDR